MGVEEVQLKLGTQFNLLDNVVAKDIEDGDLTKSIIVDDGGFDFNKTGIYKVTYSVTDSDENRVTKTKNIVVYSGTSYASDVSWESATTGWREVNKDKAVGSNNKIKLKVDGTIKEFDKGIGVATNSEIVYNLENKGYEYFTTYVGTDKNYNDNRTSIDFKILADGVEIYKSKTIRKDSEAEFVKIPLSGVKELRLVANDHDGSEAIYERGIGSHANATIIYDLSDKNYEYFTSFVGVDRVMYNSVGSVSFEVHVDGVKKFDSGLMTAKETQKFVEVDINDAKELKLIVKDGGNGIGSDHATWADAKLHFVNSERDDLTVVDIKDADLNKAIKSALKIGDRDITLADMHSLVSLDCEGGYVRDLSGLEYAVNLQSLNVDYNEVMDISAIKDLKKLKTFSSKENFILKPPSEMKLEDGKYVLEDVVIDSDGERLLPKEVVLSPNKNPKKLNLEDVLVGNKVVIDASLVEGYGSVEIMYESKYHDYQLYTLGLF
ncbi:MAG: NPCBM/NEW2 domain-containing protein [Peptostreptococcaceae bacterium]